ncbi:MAG: branched-chain amino acid ABC transporter permease [Deltaproteobacteria bacterium]|nr:branched-chain amino acid ABC transporter permease [Deltaproteobacteria bacterium]
MQNKNNLLQKGFVTILVLAGIFLPLLIKDQYILHIIISIFIWSILTLGIRMVLLAGHLNCAQASFMGLGAYGSGVLALKLGWSFWLCLPAAGIIAAILALGIGYPTLRIKGAYFVIVTLGLTEVIKHIWMMWTGLFGGPQGLLGIPMPDPIRVFNWVILFNSKVPFYYLALILFLLTVLVMHRFDLSRVGLILKAIPQSDLLAECVGVNIMKYKLTAFVVGAFFAGLAGSFWAHYFTYCSPWDFTLGASFTMLLYAIMGGIGSVAGPIIGTALMLILDEVLRPFKEYMPIILGGILVLVLLFAPGGILSIPEKFRHALKRMPSEK